MPWIKVSKKAAKVIRKLRKQSRYYEVLAFISFAQEAAIEARSALTKEQTWDLFTAIQQYKCLVDELANYQSVCPPSNLCLFKEDEVGELK